MQFIEYIKKQQSRIDRTQNNELKTICETIEMRIIIFVK